MKVLYNYAHLNPIDYHGRPRPQSVIDKYLKTQEYSTKTAYDVGGFDKVHQFRKTDFDRDFMEKNRSILDMSKGAGYWLWKYYFAVKLLNDDMIPEDSYIFYSDSDCHFLEPIDKLIEVLDRDEQSIMTFRQNHLSHLCTKRDTFLLMDADTPEYTNTGQRVGGWFLFKKNPISRKFFSECLIYGSDPRIITDIPNQLGQPNYPGFFTHRHDESLISIMSKKYELFPYRNPSQHGFDDDVYFTNNRYDKVGFDEMIKKFGPISTWTENHDGRYFWGESINQYPSFDIDDKSTYPTIVGLHGSDWRIPTE